MRRMFSEKQIQESVATAISAGLLENLDIKVKTIEQSVPNKEFSVSVPTNLQGCVLSEHSFMKAKVINGIFYFIVEAKLSNDTGSGQSFSSLEFVVDVDDEVGKRIFKNDGTSLFDNSEATVISNDQMNRDSTVVSLAVRSYSKNRIQVYVPSFNLGDGYSTNLSFRFFYSLI